MNQQNSLRFDVIAGLVTAAVVIPKAMAYATIAGVPVQVGLCTALIPMVIYAFIGTSQALSVSTTTTLAILTSASFQNLAPHADRESATLTFLVGIILVLASLLRLGFIANFISEPVLIGFKAGIALVIVLDQIPKLLGIHFAKGSFIHNLLSTIRGIPETSLPTLILGIVTVSLLLGLEHFAPRVPAPLFAVALGIFGMSIFGLHTYGVESVGQIPRGLPSLSLPDFSLMSSLWTGALGIALMSFTETIAAGRAFATSDERPPRPNRELLAMGLANTAGAFLGAMPSGGGTSQTAVNRLSGARTQAAELVTAATTLVTMLVLAPLMGRMPQATLAAVVVVYSLGLIKPQDFLSILRIRRMEFVWALTALAGVVVLGTLKGIVVAIIVSLVAMAHQVANPPVYRMGRKRSTNVFRPFTIEHPDDETFPGLLLLRLEGRVFFANAEYIREKMRALIEEANPKVVVVDLSGVFDLEYTALNMLIEAEKRFRARGVSLWLVGLNPQVLTMVQRSSLWETMGTEQLLFNLELAVAKFAT